MPRFTAIVISVMVALCTCACPLVLFASGAQEIRTLQQADVFVQQTADTVCDTNDVRDTVCIRVFSHIPALHHLRAVYRDETSSGSADVYRDNEGDSCFLRVFSRTVMLLDAIILVKLILSVRTANLIRALKFGDIIDCIHNTDGMK